MYATRVDNNFSEEARIPLPHSWLWHDDDNDDDDDDDDDDDNDDDDDDDDDDKDKGQGSIMNSCKEKAMLSLVNCYLHFGQIVHSISYHPSEW